MNAPLFSPHAKPSKDPIAAQLRHFAASYGLVLPATVPTLDVAWEMLSSAGVQPPGLAFASWAQTMALGGLLASILANSPDVRSMLGNLERFHPMVDRDHIVLTRRASSVAVTLRSPDGGPAHPDTVDASFAVLCRAARRLAGEDAFPSRVRLRRRAPADTSAYSAIFGTVGFGQPVDSCVFGDEALRSPITQADPVVRSMLEPYARRRVRHRHRPWAASVGELLSTDPDAIPALPDVARAMTVSSRTLQLRLDEEGTSFSVLADAVRRERALALIAQPGLTVTAIAARLAFATPAAFTRAFRRWTGTTPSQYRRAGL